MHIQTAPVTAPTLLASFPGEAPPHCRDTVLAAAEALAAYFCEPIKLTIEHGNPSNRQRSENTVQPGADETAEHLEKPARRAKTKGGA
jgi:hypothetical protein